MTADPFDLGRFVSAQAGVHDRAVEELRAGRKRSHWMWFIFPQLRALGRSPTAQHYGIASLAEASAYLEHPVLGPRLEAAGRRPGEPGEFVARAVRVAGRPQIPLIHDVVRGRCAQRTLPCCSDAMV
jgi:hypothetical protein